MPPKRKALAEIASNEMPAGPRRSGRNAKSTKISPDTSAPNPSTHTIPIARPSTKKTRVAAHKKTYKYSNPSTLSEKPSWLNLQWPNIGDFLDDKDQDMPKEGELIAPWLDRVSDLGIPVTEAGMEMCRKLSTECEKRDQNSKGIYIYNDWNGWGMSEVMSNHLKDFNRDIFKKNISPFKKWGYVEAVACFFSGEDITEWMMNEDGDGTKEIINMLGVMTLTTFEMLSEHDLFKPDSEIKNIPIICLMLLDFVENEAGVCECSWGCEIVRACDEAGIKLEDHVRKQVSVSKDMLDRLRGAYMEKKESSEHAADEDEGNGYKTFAKMEGWAPEDDDDDDGYGRMWYRWDWALEYKPFKEKHPGGKHYDLSKMSKTEMKQYSSPGGFFFN